MKNIIFTVLCFITVLQCSGNVLELRMPEDLDFSRNLFFIRGKAYPVKFDRNRVWIKRGKTAAFTGNTLDIHFTGHGEKSIDLSLTANRSPLRPAANGAASTLLMLGSWVRAPSGSLKVKGVR